MVKVEKGLLEVFLPKLVDLFFSDPRPLYPPTPAVLPFLSPSSTWSSGSGLLPVDRLVGWAHFSVVADFLGVVAGEDY